MITELNDYLSVTTSFERRGVLLETARVLESVVGENIYIAIDEVLADPNAPDTNSTIDAICEALLASMELAFGKFGVFFDEELIDKQHLPALAATLEALCQLELNEARDHICAIIDSSDDAQEALCNVLEEIAPGTSAIIEELVLRVDYNLIYRLRELLREPEARVDLESIDESEQRVYIERCQAFRKSYGRPPLVGALLDKGAKLRYDPAVTLSLLSRELDTADAPTAAKELYALVVFSNTANQEIIATTKRIIEQVCVDPEHVFKVTDAFQSLLGAQK